MFNLYFDKEKYSIVVGTIKNNLSMEAECTDEITRYNSCYLLCNNRKLLQEEAKHMKEMWIKETEDELIRLNNIKIKNKY